jgi:hypothetical protein
VRRDARSIPTLVLYRGIVNGNYALRTESLVAAAVQWAERIMRKIDSVQS